MKRIMASGMILLILALLLCSCGGQSKATITTKSGERVSMTANELKKAYSANEISYNSTYLNAKIEFVATVKSVKSNVYFQGSSIAHDTIECKEGWYLLAPRGKKNLSNLSEGTKIFVEGRLGSAFGYRVNVDLDNLTIRG